MRFGIILLLCMIAAACSNESDLGNQPNVETDLSDRKSEIVERSSPTYFPKQMEVALGGARVLIDESDQSKLFIDFANQSAFRVSARKYADEITDFSISPSGQTLSFNIAIPGGQSSQLVAIIRSDSGEIDLFHQPGATLKGGQLISDADFIFQRTTDEAEPLELVAVETLRSIDWQRISSLGGILTWQQLGSKETRSVAQCGIDDGRIVVFSQADLFATSDRISIKVLSAILSGPSGPYRSFKSAENLPIGLSFSLEADEDSEVGFCADDFTSIADPVWLGYVGSNLESASKVYRNGEISIGAQTFHLWEILAPFALTDDERAIVGYSFANGQLDAVLTSFTGTFWLVTCGQFNTGLPTECKVASERIEVDPSRSIYLFE